MTRADAMAPPHAFRRVSFTAITHRGLRRAGNEDTVAIGGWLGSTDMDSPLQRVVDLTAPAFCAVADGMGGHEGGALASRYALSRLAREAAGLTDGARVAAFLQQLDRDLIQIGADRAAARPPGTTLAAVLFFPGAAPLGVNIGDSRIYRLGTDRIARLSVDHTEGGHPEGAATDPDDRTGKGGHALTQALGGKHAPDRLDPHVFALPDLRGARVLVCSDGLSDVVGTTDITRLSQEHARDDSALALSLFTLAMDRGGPDNISVCIARPLT